MVSEVLSLAIIFFLVIINITTLVVGRIALLEIVFGVMTPLIALSLTNTPVFPTLNFLVVFLAIILLYDSFKLMLS